MAEPLVRFGVAMEASLLKAFDGWVTGRGSTRSKAIADLARAAVSRDQTEGGAHGVAVLSLVYDHHVRELTEKLTELQHTLGEAIRASLHVHLDHDHCLEVVIMHGLPAQLRTFSDQLLGMRGVKHGGLEIIAGFAGGMHGKQSNDHSHGAAHQHDKPLRPRRKAVPKRAARRVARGEGAR